MSSPPSATSPGEVIGAGAKLSTSAPYARFQSRAASDSDASDGDASAGADGSPGRARSTRRAPVAASSSPTKEPTAEELDAIVTKLRDEARAEMVASDAVNGPAPTKRRTYGRAGGLLRKAALPTAPTDAPATDNLNGLPQKLFGSSSLTSLDPSSEAASAQIVGDSSQRTATGSEADDPDRTIAARSSSVGRPQPLRPEGSSSRRLVSSDDDSDEDAAETYTFAARRRTRPSAGGQPTRVVSSSSVVVSSPPVATTQAPHASAALAKRPAGVVPSSSPATTAASKPLSNLARPFRPRPPACAPLGLGPEDSTVSFGTGRSPSPVIGDFGPDHGSQGSATAEDDDEEERLRAVRLTPPPSSQASTSASSPAKRALSSSPGKRPSASSTRAASARPEPKTIGGRRVLVDSDDEEGVVAVEQDEMAALFGEDGRGAAGHEPWVGDVVRAVKEKRRGGEGSPPPPERPTGGAKGLSKKELEKMKLEQARMQRERKTVIDKPEQETRDMLTFLRRKREAAAARKTQTNPLDTQRFFRDSPQPATSSASGLFSTPLPIGRPSSVRIPTPALTFAATAATEGESTADSSDPIISSNPGLAQPLAPASRRSSDRHQIVLDGSGSDGDETFDDVDALFAKKRRAEAVQAAKEQAERERRDRLRAVKERAAALALAASKGKPVKLAGESDSDSDLEIASTAVADIKPTVGSKAGTPAAAVNKEVTAKTERNSLVHRNLAKYGVVHKAARNSAGGAGQTGSGGKRAAPAQATESQIHAAGLTFGHGTSSPAGPGASKRAGGKVHHARPITKDDLAASLLAKAQAQRRKEIAAKDAKHGRASGLDARWTQKEETDYDGLMQGAQVRKSDWILIADDPEASGEDDDDAEDGDFDPDAVDDDDAAEPAAGSDDNGEGEKAAASEVDEMVADDEATAAAVVGGARSPGADSQHSDKENALPAGAAPPDESNKESRPSSGVLEERPLVVAENDDDEEESFPMPHRAKRRRTILSDEDEDEDGPRSPRLPRADRLGSPLSRGKRASFGVLLSPSASPQPSPAPTAFASTASLGPAFGATASDDAFGGGAPDDADDGFGGSGGFSQFFEPTQAATVATERTAESQGMDLDGEGGFSQFFSQTQAPPKADASKEGGLKQLRALAHDAPLRPEMSQLPSLDVSASQQEAVAEALARDAAGHENDDENDDVEPPRTGRKMFINQDGFFTQNEPLTFVMDETPNRPTQANPLTTPATPSVHQGLQAPLAASSSSPVKPVRKLVRRQDRVPTEEPAAAVEDDDDVVADSQPPASPPRFAPIFRPAEKTARDQDRPRKPRVMTDEIRALMEDQAVESDEDDGFGQFGQTRASDDEADEDEDQDKPVEGLVNDEEMTADAEKQADEERARLARELAEAEDERQMKIAQDVTTGEFRKKKKDALSMEMDSDEEDQYGTSKRSKEERRRKRKLDKLDEMERLEFDPETAPFAKMYADTYNDDAEEYGNLLSEDDDAVVPGSEPNDFAESLGIAKPRQHRRRIIASPEPLSRNGSSTSVIRLYDDGSDVDDADDDGLTESQVQIRRGGAHRPQAHPIQQDDDAYSLGVSTGYSNSDTSQRQQSQDSRRQKLESFARDEAQNTSAAKGGSTSSVTGLKRKASSSALGSGGAAGAVKRRVTQLVDKAGTATKALLGPRLSKKWEK